MNKYTELLDNYFSGRMSAAEQRAFEKQLETNAELKVEFDKHHELMNGIERAGFRAELSAGFKKGSFKSKAGKWLMGITIATLALATVFVVKNKLLSNQDHVHHELTEENSANWSEADRQLESQFFTINGKTDTVIETKSGIVINIPSGSFLNTVGEEVLENYQLEIKEAMTPLEIMKAGLSTTSNGKLLETGGMFYINARQGEKNLVIPANKPLYANIPDNNPGKNMMLFDGKRMPDGTINWVDPKPLEKNLIPVDILSLNFYPPHFLDSLAGFGFDIKNKTLTDSIYYSFVCNSELPSWVYYENDDAGEPILAKADTVAAPDGARLFQQNCASCHSLGSNFITAPGLQGVTQRVPGGDWLNKFILNSEKMIKSGNPYANKIFRENNRQSMTVFEGFLSDRDVSAIIAHIGGSAAQTVANNGSSACEIAPSCIRAIWDKKFNNTLLATKEFEARLQAIFKTCNPSILELYIKNMDRKLYEIDSLAMHITENSSAFHEFYLKKQGGVSIKADKLKKLYAYMQEKRELYKQTALKTMTALLEKENLANKKAMDERYKHSSSDEARITKVFNEELETNMREAYRQLDKPYPYESKNVSATNWNYVGGTISSTGWKNVDAYVYASTADRTTLDYTDPETGKKAVIKYEAFTLKVEDYEQYDRVVAYLIPDKLSSFQRMPFSGQNSFKENLNELFRYGATVFGFKGNDVYCNSMEDVKPGERSFSLHKLTRGELTRYSILNAGAKTDLMSELSYQLFEHKDDLRRKTIQQRHEITRRLHQVVFPCSVQQQLATAFENH